MVIHSIPRKIIVDREKEKRLKTLCYNAIGYMLEHKDSYYSMQEECEFIADYLGSTIEELTELGVLDYEDLIEKES